MTSFLTAARAEQEKLTPDTRRLRLFSGTSNPGLAREIAAYLGVPDGPRVCKRFADGELYVQIQESIRGCDVFLIQPTCAPVNDHLMELLIMVDACRRASARQITAVVPYYGYARADRKTAGRESITAKLTANLLVKSGVDRVLAMDLHSAQIQGYFDIPCDHIYGSPVLVDYLSTQNLGDIVVVSPDVGGVARAPRRNRGNNGDQRDQQQQGIGAIPCLQRQLPEAALSGWVVGGTAREPGGPATPLRRGPHPAKEAANEQGFMQGRKWRCQPQPLLAALLQQQLLHNRERCPPLAPCTGVIAA